MLWLPNNVAQAYLVTPAHSHDRRRADNDDLLEPEGATRPATTPLGNWTFFMANLMMTIGTNFIKEWNLGDESGRRFQSIGRYTHGRLQCNGMRHHRCPVRDGPSNGLSVVVIDKQGSWLWQTEEWMGRDQENGLLIGLGWGLFGGCYVFFQNLRGSASNKS